MKIEVFVYVTIFVCAGHRPEWESSNGGLFVDGGRFFSYLWLVNERRKLSL